MDAYHVLMELDEEEQDGYFPENLPQRPLAAFMGRTVDPSSSAADETSDVGKVVKYLAELGAEERRAFRDVFQGDITGPLVLSRNPTVEDELLLSFGDGDVWGIVNVGDAAKFFRDFEHPAVHKQENVIVDDRYLFQNVDRGDSPINVLVGSRKFAEGWNCFRLSVTGLLNLGSSKGNTIIQIFGRGVRLHGAEDDGKRRHLEHVDDYYKLGDGIEDEIRRLETLTIFSLKASYLETFIEKIQEEVKPRLSFSLRVNPTIMKLGEEAVDFETYRHHLPVFKSQKRDIGWKRVVLDGGVFTYEHLEGEEEGQFDSYRVQLDYRPDREVDGHNVRYKLYNKDPERSLYHRFEPFLDRAEWARTTRNASDSARIALYARTESEGLRPATLPDLFQIIDSVKYKSDLSNADPSMVDALGREIIRDVIGKIKNKVHYDINRRHYVFDEPLALSDEDTARDIIYEYVVTKEFDTQEDLEDFEKDLEVKKQEIKSTLQIGPVEEHIYEPLLNEDEKEGGLRISPDALNVGEKKFVNDLSGFVSEHYSDSERYDFYLLRNVDSLKSIGIFLESDENTFYPDFLLWVIDHETEETTIAFVDPKGEQGMVDTGKLSANEKVNLALKNDEYPTLRGLEAKLSNSHSKAINLHSFLLLRDTSGMGKTEDEDWIKENMLSRNVLRLDWHKHDELGSPSQKWNGHSYLDLMFKKIGVAEEVGVFEDGEDT